MLVETHISPMEVETKPQDAATHEPADDTAVTQELAVKVEPPVIIDLESDPQEPVEATPIVEETTKDTEATLGKNKGVDTQEPTEEVVVTQEPTAEVEKPHEQRLVHPLLIQNLEEYRFHLRMEL